MIAREGEISLFIAEYPVQPNQSRVLPFIAPSVPSVLQGKLEEFTDI
jgi:hypothetical protein